LYTDDNGIVRFESLDNIAPLQVGLNAALESVSVALDSTARIFIANNATERNSLANLHPERPIYVHRKDLGIIEFNTGSGWEPYPGKWPNTFVNLQTHVHTRFDTRELEGWTDGHTIFIHGMIGSGSIVNGGDDITRTSIPAAWRPPSGNWQGACWVSGGYPAVAFVRENGSISVVHRSGGTVAAAQFVVTYPKTR